jgi:ssDNA-binding Zn-finger/Zn-ribbon topoisomerase 1
METERRDRNEPKQLKRAHVCPQCGFSITLKDHGLRGRAVGIVTCPKCDWSGPVNIQIVDSSRASANRAAMREVAV